MTAATGAEVVRVMAERLANGEPIAARISGADAVLRELVETWAHSRALSPSAAYPRLRHTATRHAARVSRGRPPGRST